MKLITLPGILSIVFRNLFLFLLFWITNTDALLGLLIRYLGSMLASIAFLQRKVWGVIQLNIYVLL